ncbi:MAG: helix-turn-helix domain-containing protein [Lachnospiraceae bacterium]|nr:helix-turn-helix domain-containing protein [Lachnospiraceae bacterium]
MNNPYYCHVFPSMTELKEPPVMLTSIGRESRFGNDYYFDNIDRQMKGYLFQYTLSGSGVLYVGSAKKIVNKGQALFIPIPSDTKYFCNSDSREPWDFIFIHIKADCLAEYCNQIYAKCGNILSLDIDSFPIKLLFDISNQTQNGHINNFNTGSRLAFEFITKLYDYYFDNSEIYSKRNRDIIAILETSYKEIDGISAIADKFQISPSHLTREFVSEVGTTPVKYLTKVRILHAKDLLLHSDKTVGEIAQECGYDQTNYFCKIFKKTVGQTPLQYRNFLS